MGPNNIVMGWTPDGKNILFRSRMKPFNDFIGQLFTVSVDGGLAEQLPLPRGGFCSLLAGRQEARLQPRLPRVPHLEALSRRHGRRHLDLRFRHQEDRTLTNDPAQDIIPMCRGRTRSISSPTADRRSGSTSTSVDPATKQTERLTDFTDYDIKFPSLATRRSSSRTAAGSTASI